MPVIQTRDALKARREAAKAAAASRGRAKTLVNVSCGTCGIASGAERVMKAMQNAAEQLGLRDVEFMRSGCMTYCYAEPTVAISLPGKPAVTFGHVDEKAAKALVAEYIAKGTPPNGEIPVLYERVTLD